MLFLLKDLLSAISPSQACRKMSQIHVTSPQHCANKGLSIDKRYKKLFYTFLTFLLSILLLIFIIYLSLHPSKPEFSLKEAEVYQLNLTSAPQLLNSSIELTLLSKNPNQKVGIYYDGLNVYASYKGQQITVATSLPPFYQGHEDRNLLTACLVGKELPVAPSLRYEVVRDQTVGKLLLNLKVHGRLRWKVGTWVSRKYGFNVNCIAIMPFGPSAPSGPLSSIPGTRCCTTV